LHSSHFLWRQIEAATKQPIEVALIGESCHLSYFRNRQTVICEQGSGTFQSRAADKFTNGFAGEFSKRTRDIHRVVADMLI
jgi:hypothetical protein